MIFDGVFAIVVRKPYKQLMTPVIFEAIECYHVIVTDAKGFSQNVNDAFPMSL
jgi:hypothetical protein